MSSAETMRFTHAAMAELQRRLKATEATIAAITAERDAAVARADAAEALLAEITPSRLIGESHVPYPQGKMTVLMSWDWLRRVRAVKRGDHITAP